MSVYVVRRLFFSLFVLWGVLTLIFIVLRLVPGDPAALVLGTYGTEELIEEQRVKMGLDKPLYIQYVVFMRQVVFGDWGRSFRTGRSALKMVLERVPATLEFTVTGLFIAIIFSFLLGTVAALGFNSILDRMITTLSLLGQAAPGFWLGIVAILIFAGQLHLLPSFGRGGLSHLILPSMVLAVQQIGIFTRLIRSGMLEGLVQDFVVTARAKGLAERRVVVHHVLRNMLIPVITMMGLQFGALMGGAAVLEVVFAWPGVGRLLVSSINNKDYPVVQVNVTMIAIIFVLINLIVDCLYAYIDPRVRYE